MRTDPDPGGEFDGLPLAGERRGEGRDARAGQAHAHMRSCPRRQREYKGNSTPDLD